MKQRATVTLCVSWDPDAEDAPEHWRWDSMLDCPEPPVLIACERHECDGDKPCPCGTKENGS